MSLVGHNGGPPPVRLTPKAKIECIKGALARSDLTAQQKCIAIKIIAEADAEWAAEVRTADLQQAASAKDRETVFRATRQLDTLGLASKTSGQGQVGRYRVLPPSIVAAVVEAYQEVKATGRVKPDQSTDNRSGETGRHNWSASTPEPVGSNPTSRPLKPDQSVQTRPVLPDQSTRAEVSNIYNNINNLPTEKPYVSLSEKLAASAREGGTLDIGNGVLVNCETIKHAEFEISLKGIELLTLGVVPMDQIRSEAAGYAVDWASQLAAGKHARDVLPRNGTANYIARSFHYKKLDEGVNEVRKARASSKHVPRQAGESFDDMNKRILAELEKETRK